MQSGNREFANDKFSLSLPPDGLQSETTQRIIGPVRIGAMDSIDLIRDNLRRSESIVLSRIEQMREHAMLPPSAKGGCHSLWILGHLAFIEGLVIHTFMLGEPNPLNHWESVFDADVVSDDPEIYPPFDRVLQTCRSTRQQTLALLDSYQETDLDRRSASAPQTAMDLFGTYRLCFQYASDHWLMHRGQLANARLVAGLARMWF